MASIPSTSKTSIDEILRDNRGLAPPRGARPLHQLRGAAVAHQVLAVVERAVRRAVRPVALREAVALGDPGPAGGGGMRDDGEIDQPEAVEGRVAPGLVDRLEATQARCEHARPGAVAAVDDPVFPQQPGDGLVSA